ncbi:MAG: hypothetical protein ACYS8Z_17475 [Planctomycetota bacterium]|jgi:hypothetical protein
MNERDSKRSHKGLFGAVTVLLILVAVTWYSGVIEGDSRRYQVRPEIRPEIRVPEYRSDAARAIDAYERLMERYMSLSERSFGDVGTDLKDVSRKLDSIEGQLRGLSARMGRIEKALGIEPSKPAVPKKEALSELEGKEEGTSLPKVAEKAKRSGDYP